MSDLEKLLQAIENESASTPLEIQLARTIRTAVGQRDELINAHVGDEDGQMAEAQDDELLRVARGVS